MQFLLNNMCFYNTWQRLRRVCLRAIGLIVALFSSTHARAYLSTACPWCEIFPNSICDTSTAQDYSSRVVGRFVQGCIPSQNKGQNYPQIQDSACVQKLQAIGMCDGNEGGSTVSFLYQSGLNCTSGVSSTPDFYTYYCGYTYQTSEFFADVVQMASINSYVSYPYICCDLDCGYNGVYNCCISQSPCIMPMVCGYGACPSGYYYQQQLYSNSGSTDGDLSCTEEFQEYFGGSQISTGWCDPTTGKIMVEGIGALLVSHFCYGTDYIPQYGNLIQAFCGMIVEGCETENGYYVNKSLPGDPAYYGQSGYTDSDYCPKCPTDVSGYSSNHNFTISSNSNLHGITSCQATAGNPTVSNSDTSGKFEITIPSTCPYLK